MAEHIEWVMAVDTSHKLVDSEAQFFESGDQVAPYNHGLLITTPDGDGILLEGQLGEIAAQLASMTGLVLAEMAKEGLL